MHVYLIIICCLQAVRARRMHLGSREMIINDWIGVPLDAKMIHGFLVYYQLVNVYYFVLYVNSTLPLLEPR